MAAPPTAAMEPTDERPEDGTDVGTPPARVGDAAMEPTDKRPEHPGLHPRRPDLVRAAMEPADERPEHGSRNLSRLSCENSSVSEQLATTTSEVTTMDVSRNGKRGLTCVRALPRNRVSTPALASGSYDDRS